MAMKVRCKYCGAENTKEESQHVVKCSKCGEETTYFVLPGIMKRPAK